ncbi:MAG TPA: hypothetical protein VFG98_02850 [Intrasporangium sp.]|nr:hypothetical protein [Intrasporangium sp.]
MGEGRSSEVLTAAGAAEDQSRPGAVTRSGQVLRRLGWGVGDQAVSSLTNFAVAATAAHLLDPAHLGVYSLAFLTYAVALTASRGLATDPLMVRLGGADHDTWRRAVQRAAGTSLMVGVALGLALLVVAFLLSEPTRGAMLSLGVTLPILLLQDAWRHAFFVAGQGKRALLNDLVWGAALVPSLWVVAATDNRTASWFVLAWGGSALVAVAVGWRQTSVTPRPDKARAWLLEHRDLNVRFMLEGMAGSASGQLRATGVGLALGLSAVGYLQVVNTFMGPFQILLLGTGVVIIPELSAIIRHNEERLLHACLVRSVALAAAALVWGTMLWTLLPLGVGQVLVGDVWEQAHPLVPAATVALLGTSFAAGAGAGLHALGAARRSLRVMVIASLLVVLLSLAGALAAGLQGTLIGTAVASGVGAGLFWRELRQQVQVDLGDPQHAEVSKGRGEG